MATAPISFGGLATGLDTKSIVAKLVSLRQQPITRMQTQKSDLSKSLSILNDLRDNIVALGELAAGLDSPSEFASKSATSSSEGVLTATASSSSVLGSYAIVVDHLATADRNVSQSLSSASESVGAGTFSFTIDGNTTDITLSAGSDTLADLKSAINAAGAGVTASVMNDGSGYRLVLSSDETGASNRITIDASGLSGGTTLSFTNTQQADDAALTIDTIPVTSSTNSVEGAIEGMTLELTGAGSSTVTVASDGGQLKQKLQDFVDAYNKVATVLNDQSQKGAPLNGSSLLRTVRDRLTRTLTQTVATGGDYRMLADVGIKFDRDGMLSLDTAKLDEALGGDYNSVLKLFVDDGTTQGVASLMKSAVDDLTDFSSGLFKLREKSINDQIASIDDQITQEQRRVDSYETQLNQKFTAMEMAISQLQAQSGYLNSIG